jgi:metal transporter CNNM
VICGALDLTSKTARQAMTPLRKAFMLSSDARLDRPTLLAIVRSGHSRVPVYRGAGRLRVGRGEQKRARR